MDYKNTLREFVMDAASKHTAIGHFNVSSLEMVHGIVRAALTLKAPVIIGVSEGERDFMGIEEVRALVTALREKHKHPIFLNADHTYSFERVKEVVDAGYDAVIYDGTEFPFEKNVAETKKCVEYIKEYKNRTGKDIMLESEIGFIGKSSKVLDSIPEGVKIGEEFLTKPEEAKNFIELTGADMLAPAVGNIHGMLKGGVDPELNLNRILDIHSAVPVPLVLHGGSGGSERDFLGAVKNGCAIVHISTELRVAYRSAIMNSLTVNPDEVAPYKYLRPTIKAVEAVVEQKIKLFGYTL
ncbi:MAG: class II fructose-bisphosphate aldolase [bacterium]